VSASRAGRIARSFLIRSSARESSPLSHRYLHQDYAKDNFVWNMAAHGAYLGLGIRF
jgi:hypothetical protein